MNERKTALKILEEIQGGVFCNIALRDGLKNSELTKQERAFVSRVCEGVTERRLTLVYFIERLTGKPYGRLKPVIGEILKMGLYQIFYMEGVPDSAACNESVKLVYARNMGGLSGFVNGVLRNACRQKSGLSDFSFIEDVQKRLEIEYSMPLPILNRFISECGEKRTRCALSYFVSENRTSVRVNRSRLDGAEPKEMFEEEGIESQAVFDDTDMGVFRISRYDSLEKLKCFTSGKITVQDGSSALVAKAAEPVAGLKVLDVCAAPGGKSLAFADRGAKVVSLDVSNEKIELIRQNVERCGFSDSIEYIVRDGTVFCGEYEETFDVVICDVPCSGLGIIGKKPDIRYNCADRDIEGLVSLQRRIIDNAVRYVRPGGLLMYSTCTVNREENIDNVLFIEEKGNFNREKIKLPIEAESLCDGYIQIMPGEFGTDGFFIAKLRKQGEQI